MLDGTNGPIKKFKDAIARLLDPSVDFSMSILELEVNLVYNATSHQLYDLLIKDSHLNMHLEALKDYFLLNKGEFYQCIIDECVDMFKSPPSAFATQDMNSGPLRHAGSNLHLLSNVAFSNLSFRLYAPSFMVSTFRPDMDENIILNEFSRITESNGALALQCPAVFGHVSTPMSLDKDIIPSRNSMGDHGSKIGGGVVYREAKIVEFGFASTFTARIKTNRNVSKLNDDANNAIMARLTSAAGSHKDGVCFVLQKYSNQRFAQFADR